MCTIDVGIGHDDNLVVPQLGRIHFIENTTAECSNHGSDFIVFKYSCLSCLLYIQNLTS